MADGRVGLCRKIGDINSHPTRVKTKQDTGNGCVDFNLFPSRNMASSFRKNELLSDDQLEAIAVCPEKINDLPDSEFKQMLDACLPNQNLKVQAILNDSLVDCPKNDENECRITSSELNSCFHTRRNRAVKTDDHNSLIVNSKNVISEPHHVNELTVDHIKHVKTCGFTKENVKHETDTTAVVDSDDINVTLCLPEPDEHSDENATVFEVKRDHPDCINEDSGNICHDDRKDGLKGVAKKPLQKGATEPQKRRRRGVKEKGIDIEIGKIPGFRGNHPIDDLVEFIDGPQSGKKSKNNVEKQKKEKSKKKGKESYDESEKLESADEKEETVDMQADQLDTSYESAQEELTPSSAFSEVTDAKPPVPPSLSESEKFHEEDFKVVIRSKKHNKRARQHTDSSVPPRRATSYDNCVEMDLVGGSGERARRNSTGSAPVNMATSPQEGTECHSDDESVQSLPVHADIAEAPVTAPPPSTVSELTRNKAPSEEPSGRTYETDRAAKMMQMRRSASAGSFTRNNYSSSKNPRMIRGQRYDSISDCRDIASAPEVYIDTDDRENFPSLPSAPQPGKGNQKPSSAPEKSYAAALTIKYNKNMGSDSVSFDLPNEDFSPAAVTSNYVTGVTVVEKLSGANNSVTICDTCANAVYKNNEDKQINVKPSSEPTSCVAETVQAGFQTESAENADDSNVGNTFQMPQFTQESVIGIETSSEILLGKLHLKPTEKKTSPEKSIRHKASRLVFEIGGGSKKSGPNSSNHGLTFGFDLDAKNENSQPSKMPGKSPSPDVTQMDVKAAIQTPDILRNATITSVNSTGDECSSVRATQGEDTRSLKQDNKTVILAMCKETVKTSQDQSVNENEIADSLSASENLSCDSKSASKQQAALHKNVSQCNTEINDKLMLGKPSVDVTKGHHSSQKGMNNGSVPSAASRDEIHHLQDLANFIGQGWTDVQRDINRGRKVVYFKLEEEVLQT